LKNEIRGKIYAEIFLKKVKTAPKILPEEIAEMKAKIDLLQSEMDILLGNYFEFENSKDAQNFFQKNY